MIVTNLMMLFDLNVSFFIATDTGESLYKVINIPVLH